MSKSKSRLIVLIMVCQHIQSEVLIHLVPKVLEPNTYSRNLLPLQNFWTLQYMNATLLHKFQYMTNQRCTAPSMWLTHQLEKDVGCKVLYFINNEDQEALGYKTLRRKDAVAFFRENKRLFGFCVSITHNSVSITHNSKMVGPTERKLVWICFQVLFPSLNSLIFEWWVMETENTF